MFDIKSLIVQVLMFAWPFAVKYVPSLKKIPNDIIPWLNWLLALFTGLAAAPAGAISLGGSAAGVLAASLVLFVATRHGYFVGALTAVGAALGWQLSMQPAYAAGGTTGAVVSWLAPVAAAGWESIKLALVYKVFGQPIAEKGLKLTNWQKQEASRQVR